MDNIVNPASHDNQNRWSSCDFDQSQFDERSDLVTNVAHVEDERTIFRTYWQEEQVRLQKRKLVIPD